MYFITWGFPPPTQCVSITCNLPHDQLWYIHQYCWCLWLQQTTLLTTALQINYQRVKMSSLYITTCEPFLYDFTSDICRQHFSWRIISLYRPLNWWSYQLWWQHFSKTTLNVYNYWRLILCNANIYYLMLTVWHIHCFQTFTCVTML